MARVKKGTKMSDETSTEDGIESDIDENELPPQADLSDNDDDDEFEFDMSLVPRQIAGSLIDLAPDFIRPKGFLMVPRLNKKTGEIMPQTSTFAGILNDVVPWKDARGKERLWFSCTAAADIPGVYYTGKNEDGTTFVSPVLKGETIGISGSGAITALKSKKGHFVYLHWTGNKKPTKNGDMWEIKAKVSPEPIV
jgi:hypothetical protein